MQRPYESANTLTARDDLVDYGQLLVGSGVEVAQVLIIALFDMVQCAYTLD